MTAAELKMLVEIKMLVTIALERIPAPGGRKDLERQCLSEADFIETAVGYLQDALAAAYEAGKSAGKKEAAKK